jgi:uncharacterized membrane protein
VSRRDRWWLAALCLLVAGAYSGYAWVRHLRFLTTGFDLGIFDQAVRAYSRFEPPIVPLKAPGYHLLGDHFHPIIAAWAPLYWVWDDPRMLLVAQAVLIAVSMVPVAAFTARRLGSRPALVVAVLYGLSWPLQRMAQFDVHEIAFAIPLIAVVIDAIDRRAHLITVAACLALLATREDMGAFVVLAGVLVALRGVGLGDLRRRAGSDGARRRPAGRELAWGGGLVLLGAAGYRLATGVVIPHFAGGTGFVYWTFPALGPDLASAARFAITQPWSVLTLMVTPWRKAQTLIALGMPTLYLCLGSRYLLLALPFLAQRLLNSRELLWSTNFHYSGVLAPIMFMAAVDSVSRLIEWIRRRTGAGRLDRQRGQQMVRAWLGGCAAVLIVGMLMQAGDYPLSRMWTARFWQPDLRAQAIERVLPRIPVRECVEADNAIAAQLTPRNYVTRVGRSKDLATWLVLDFSRNDTGWEGTTPRLAYDEALRRGFEPVVQDDVIVLLRRPGPVAARCRVG